MQFYKIKLNDLFVVTTLLWIGRMAIPELWYLLVPAYLTFISALIIKLLHTPKIVFFEFFQITTPIIILFIFYIIGIFNTPQIFKKAIIDLTEFCINFSLILYVFIYIYQHQNKKYFHQVFNQLVSLLQKFAIIVSILGIIKFLTQISGYNFNNYTWGTSLNSDANMYALFMFSGISTFINNLFIKENKPDKLVNQLYLLLLIVNIIFSFSIRSILLLQIIIFILIIAHLNPVIKLKNKFQKLNIFLTNTKQLFIILTLFFITFLYYQKPIENYFIKHSTQHFSKKNTSSLIKNTFNIDNWKYAVKIYSNYNFHEKLFGKGFNYLKLYSQEKSLKSNIYNYPHNPVLTALLYSGIIGAIFTVIFIILSFYYTISGFKEYPVFGFMTFISLFFVLFSGNSIFSIPIFIFLFSLSFIIHQIEISELVSEININKPASKIAKEFFDYILATLSFIILLPVLITISALIYFKMGKPILFSQKRIGRNAKPFTLYKFRTMSNKKSKTSVAAAETYRITHFGAFLRRTKLDELPELWNIIRGDMSFVGPRPDVPGYADKLKGDDRIILQLKPGLTGPASLKYKNEEEILKQQINPQKYNDEVIFPDKVKINKLYMKNWTLFLDIAIIAKTALGKSFSENDFTKK